jgi:hypothetical protein
MAQDEGKSGGVGDEPVHKILQQPPLQRENKQATTGAKTVIIGKLLPK